MYDFKYQTVYSSGKSLDKINHHRNACIIKLQVFAVVNSEDVIR